MTKNKTISIICPNCGDTAHYNHKNNTSFCETCLMITIYETNQPEK